MSSLIQVDYAPEWEFSNCRRIHFRADIPKQKAGPLMLPQKKPSAAPTRDTSPRYAFFAFGAAMRGLQCPAAVFYLVILLLYSPLLTLIGLANVAVCLGDHLSQQPGA